MSDRKETATEALTRQAREGMRSPSPIVTADLFDFNTLAENPLLLVAVRAGLSQEHLIHALVAENTCLRQRLRETLDLTATPLRLGLTDRQ
jgi:hypothetical protein